MWSAITVDTVRELKKLPDGSARLIALLRHIHQSLSRTSQLPAIDTVLTVHMRNCCHLIARVCPVLFENCSVEQVDEMFWLPTVNAQLPLGWLTPATPQRGSHAMQFPCLDPALEQCGSHRARASKRDTRRR